MVDTNNKLYSQKQIAMQESEPSVTKSDIDSLVSRITDNEDLTYYLPKTEKLDIKCKINNLVAELSKSNNYCDCGTKMIYKCKICGNILYDNDEDKTRKCICIGIGINDEITMELIDNSDTNCDVCDGIYIHFNCNHDIAEILKILAANLKCDLSVEWGNDEGHMFIEKYEYTCKFDNNLMLSYDYNIYKENYIKNAITNTTYDLNKRRHKYFDVIKMSKFLNNNWDKSNYIDGILKNIDPNLFNTTEVWNYTTAKYPNVSHEKISILLLELIYLLMDTIMED